ncbi:hypothetical protein EDC01DRAFT_162976 [Geopyxis carbonaria]|nr:hypothetical protein EDC01DRAFT_162976 [Geopyxis carbonaria]
MSILSRRPTGAEGTLGNPALHPFLEKEERGAVKAAGMTNCWSKVDLVSCFVLLLILVNLFNFWGVFCPIMMKSIYSDTLWPTSSLDADYLWFLTNICSLLGFMIFAKLANSTSRAFGLGASTFMCIIGLIITSEVNKIGEDGYALGTILFELGRSGVFIVAGVIVADCSDLSWRGLCFWILHCTVIVWIWLPNSMQVFVEHWKDPIKEWRLAILTMAISITTLSVPTVVVLLLYVRRAYHKGFYPESKRHNFCSFLGIWDNIRTCNHNFDFFGVLLWSVGLVAIIGSTLSLPTYSKMSKTRWISLGVGISTLGCFLVWELYLNRAFIFKEEIEGNEPEWQLPPNTSYNNTNQENVVALPALIDNTETECPNAGVILPVDFAAQRKGVAAKYQPLISPSLLKTGELTAACVIVACSGLCVIFGIMIVGNMPLEDPNMDVKWREKYPQVATTCAMLAGLVASLIILWCKRVKYISVVGMAMQLVGLLWMLAASVTKSKSAVLSFLYIPQIMLPVGYGLVEIPILISTHMACETRSDITIATALLLTIKAISFQAAEFFGQGIIFFYNPYPAFGIGGMHSYMDSTPVSPNKVGEV